MMPGYNPLYYSYSSPNKRDRFIPIDIQGGTYEDYVRIGLENAPPSYSLTPEPPVEKRIFEPHYTFERFSKGVVHLDDGIAYFPWKHAMLYDFDPRFRFRCKRRYKDLFTYSYCFAILYCIHDILWCGREIVRIVFCMLRGKLGYESLEVDPKLYDGFWEDAKRPSVNMAHYPNLKGLWING